MIRCEQLSFTYPKEGVTHPTTEGSREALHHVNLHLDEGSFTFLTGKSGAGKSSFLRILALNDAPTSGRLTLFNKDTQQLTRDERAQMRRNIGLVFQHHHLLPHLTIAENVALPLKIAGESPRLMHQKTEELLHWAGLREGANELPRALSGGEKQRAAIARAVITNPRIILADEPTGNLDHALSIRFMQLFKQLHQGGTTILFATHDESLLSQFSYPRIRIEDGRLKR